MKTSLVTGQAAFGKNINIAVAKNIVAPKEFWDRVANPLCNAEKEIMQKALNDLKSLPKGDILILEQTSRQPNERGSGGFISVFNAYLQSAKGEKPEYITGQELSGWANFLKYVSSRLNGTAPMEKCNLL